MLLAFLLLPADVTSASVAADSDPLICVDHAVRPTVFTPKRECMRARHWMRVLRSRERNNLRIANPAQARASLPYSALYLGDRSHEGRGITPGERIDTPPSFLLPPVPGSAFRR